MELQLFNQEATEEATPKRLREAREQGRTVKSADLATGIGLVTAAMALKGFGFSIYTQLSAGAAQSFTHLNERDITVTDLSKHLLPWGMVMLRAFGPIALTFIAVGTFTGLLQTGLLVSTKGLIPDFKRINPVSGFTKLFSMQTLVEMLKGILKLAAIGYVAYGDVRSNYLAMPSLLSMAPAGSLSVIASTAVDVLLHIGMLLLALGMLDYGYQWWEFRKSLRMTKQEIKEEQKQTEGRPELKARQRQKAREMARQRKAIANVPKAHVVITNPTHYAIAVRYQSGADDAPTVLAKGVDLMAQQIREIAKQNDVPMVENRPLARTLYDTVDIGKSVPPELYQAVAEVLAFVFNLKRQKRREGR